MLCRLYCTILILLSFGFCLSQNRSYTETLYDTVLTNYNRYIRPNENQSHSTIVYVSFFMLSLKDFDEVTGKFSVVGYFYLIWNDPRMVWTPADYENVEKLYIPQRLVWKPELTLVNAYQYIKAVGFDDLPILYFYNATARWMVGEVMDTTCDVDVTFFPFDKQICKLEFAAWGYTSNQLTFQTIQENIDFSRFSENVEWVITKTKGYELTSRDQASIVYEVEMERRYTFFIVNVFIPVIMLTLLSNMVFLLPADSGERVGYSVTCLLAVSVFLTIVSDTLPKASNPVSVLTFFLMCDFVMSTSICICTILGLILHHKDVTKPVPKWVKRVTDFFTCKVCTPKSFHRQIKVKEAKGNGIEVTPEISSSKSISDVNVSVHTPKTDRKNDTSELTSRSKSKNSHLHVSRDRKVLPIQIEPEPDVNPEDEDEEVFTWKTVANIYDKVCFVIGISVVLFLMVVYTLFTNLV
ncbi:neuronal acetylcholine receptor subunit alpha-6-like [Ylistrum balloti]|uniref:neuronal acetylcholine receptor subunit alpha-6-like n=1 Tax=Ylistrum balloti TaxID=509963 RepID=UPI002905B2CD|nr:neuronal acetylcholine receptor subunit alpha-6-like [Ylistrum balloti]